MTINRLTIFFAYPLYRVSLFSFINFVPFFFLISLFQTLMGSAIVSRKREGVRQVKKFENHCYKAFIKIKFVLKLPEKSTLQSYTYQFNFCCWTTFKRPIKFENNFSYGIHIFKAVYSTF